MTECSKKYKLLITSLHGININSIIILVQPEMGSSFKDIILKYMFKSLLGEVMLIIYWLINNKIVSK